MTEDSTHTLLVCDFCGNKEPLNYPVQNQTPNQGQYTNSSLQTTQHTYGNNSIQSTNTNGCLLYTSIKIAKIVFE